MAAFSLTSMSDLDSSPREIAGRIAQAVRFPGACPPSPAEPGIGGQRAVRTDAGDARVAGDESVAVVNRRVGEQPTFRVDLPGPLPVLNDSLLSMNCSLIVGDSDPHGLHLTAAAIFEYQIGDV